MGNYSKYKNVNTVFGGLEGITVPTGGTADRSPAVVVGTIRYNTDLGLVEQYNANGWTAIDAPPTISSVNGVINENTSSTITVNGANFKTGCIVSISGAAVGGIDRPLVTTFVGSSQVTAATNATAVTYVGGANFDIKVLNPSGLAATLSPGGTIDRDPLWSTSNASAFQIYDGSRGTTLTFTAADPDGSGTITYSLVGGSLPTGASLNTSTGGVSGFSAVGSDATATFTLRATSSVGPQSADRQFQITVKAPVVASFTSVTSGTFSVPTGVTQVQVLVVAGGGAGGDNVGGGGGGGGMVEAPAYPVTPGGSIPWTVGGGGTANARGGGGSNGSNSVFGVITANGGGGGGGFEGGGGGPNAAGNPGGSAGSPGWNAPQASSNQGSFPAVGATGYGNAGGTPGPTWCSGGGGGAGGAGRTANNQTNGSGGGGVGRANSITGSPVFYAGGGGGCTQDGTPSPGGSGGGGYGGQTSPGVGAQAGTNGLGGGGGGNRDVSPRVMNGGSGIVIVRY
jgi:hypothetical protein